MHRPNTETALQTWWQRHPRAAFYALGIAVTALCGAIQVFWVQIANDVFHLGVSFDTRPAWLRAVMFSVRWLPALVLAVIVVGRLRRGRTYRPLAFVAGAISVYLVTMGILLGGPVVDAYWHQATFEAGAWRRNDRSNVMWPARLTMADDLLARGLLDGVTRDSVARLLGPRDSTDYFTDWELVYWLGPERGLIRIDSEWLVIAFGPDGRVSAARLVRD